jgi:hypothetical protein
MRVSALSFFHQSIPLRPLVNTLKYFCIWFRFPGDIRECVDSALCRIARSPGQKCRQSESSSRSPMDQFLIDCYIKECYKGRKFGVSTPRYAKSTLRYARIVRSQHILLKKNSAHISESIWHCEESIHQIYYIVAFLKVTIYQKLIHKVSLNSLLKINSTLCCIGRS